MKIWHLILVMSLSMNAFASVSRFDEEPFYETLGKPKSVDENLIRDIKTVLARKYAHPLEDISFSLTASETVKLEGEIYERHFFQLVLKDEKGAHGYNVHALVVWLDNQKKLYKIYDTGTYSPL